MLFAVVGPGAWLSAVLGFGLALLLAAVFSQYATRIAAPGSLYTFATQGLGAGAGFATAAALLVGYGFISMFGLVGAAYFLQHFAAVFAGAWALSPGATWNSARYPPLSWPVCRPITSRSSGRPTTLRRVSVQWGAISWSLGTACEADTG